MVLKPYRWILHKDYREKLRKWRMAMSRGVVKPGAKLSYVLQGKDPSEMTSPALFEALTQTREPAIFAESEVKGDGSDWTFEELSILGDATLAVPVTFFDNGRHIHPQIHNPPFQGNLLFMSGALLRNDSGNPVPDRSECVEYGALKPKAYQNLIMRRLRPLLMFANHEAGSKNMKAVVTIPGIGCGQFAGNVPGIPEELQNAIQALLKAEGLRLKNISCVRLDTYATLENCEEVIHDIRFRVRPLLKGNNLTPQLSAPQELEEAPGEFKDHILSSVVAWDPVSWPGNDFYIGNRTTDDGVKAAASNLIERITGLPGAYDEKHHRFDCKQNPEDPWESIIKKHGIALRTEGHCVIEKKSTETLH